MKIMVRRAKMADIDMLAALNSEVQSLHLKTFPEIYKPVKESKVKAFFESILKNREYTILVGDSMKGIVGYISLRVLKKDETPFTWERKVVYIDQIVIKEKFRHQGFGQRLIKEASKFAKRRGASWLQLDVWDFNKSAQFFFSASGFDTFVRCMVKKL